MRSLLTVVVLACVVTGCNSQSSSNDTYADLRTNQKVQLDLPPLSDTDFLRVCKAGAAFRNGREVAGISARITSDRLVRLGYTRDQDGKKFEYDCKVEGNVIRYRMIDGRGPNTGPDIWSGAGSTTTFEVHEKSIEFFEEYPDGSSDQESVEI